MRSRVLALAAVLAIPSGCSINKMVADNMAGALRDQERALNREGSVRHAREAAPGALKMLDGFIVSSPENVDLLLAGAKQNAGFAFAFIEEEDNAWARVLYRRAREYGLRALAEEDGDLRESLCWGTSVRTPLREEYLHLGSKGAQVAFMLGGDAPRPLEEALAALTPGDDAIPALFWAAFAWGGLVNVSKEDQDLLTDVPVIVKVMERLAAIAPEYEHGGAHLFLAVYYGSRGSTIGGDVKKSAQHFDAVSAITMGRYPIVEVLRARWLCVAQGEKEPAKARAEFARRLEAVLATPDDVDPENVLATALAKSRARKLLKEIDDYILPPLPEDEPPAPAPVKGGPKK